MLLDTSGLLCLLDPRNEHHAGAVALYDRATARITHNYVLNEFVALAHARRLRRETALAFVARFPHDPEVECLWVDEERHRAAVEFLQARLDKSWSLCDAVSFMLMQERGIMEALTTDQHFEQAGYVRLLKP